MNRNLVFLLGAALTLSLFSGCAKVSDAGSDGSFLYNASTVSTDIQNSDRYIFYLSGSKYVYIDKKTGKRGTFLHTVFNEQGTSDTADDGSSALTGFSVFGQSAYYLAESKNGTSNYGTDIHRVRLSDFHDQILYRQDTLYYRSIFLGLYSVSSPNLYDPDDDDFAENDDLQSTTDTDAAGAFVLGNTLYVITDSTVFKVDTLTGKTSTLFSYKHSLACDGTAFYYGNAQYQIVRYEIASGKTAVLPGVYAREFILTRISLFYTNPIDHNRLYQTDKNGNRKKKRTSCAVQYPAFDDQYLYFSNADDNGYPYRMKYDGSGLTRLSAQISNAITSPISHYAKIGLYGELPSSDFTDVLLDKKTFQIQDLT